jgi:hypothetical protein
MSKYHAIKTEVDGFVFDSRREAARYRELKLLEQAGKIFNLTLQPRYNMMLNGKRLGFYKADFQYITQSGAVITEDVKGVRTAVYRLKKKIVEAQYGITITEVK